MTAVSKPLSETQMEFVNALAENRGEHVLTPSGVAIGGRQFRRNTIAAVEARGIVALRGKRRQVIELSAAGWQIANAQRPTPAPAEIDETADEPIIITSDVPVDRPSLPTSAVYTVPGFRGISLRMHGDVTIVESDALQVRILHTSLVDVMSPASGRGIILSGYRCTDGRSWSVIRRGDPRGPRLCHTIGEGLVAFHGHLSRYAKEVDRMVDAAGVFLKTHSAPRIVFDLPEPPTPAIALPVPSPSPVPQLDAGALLELAEAIDVRLAMDVDDSFRSIGVEIHRSCVSARAGRFQVRLSLETETFSMDLDGEEIGWASWWDEPRPAGWRAFLHPFTKERRGVYDASPGMAISAARSKPFTKSEIALIDRMVDAAQRFLAALPVPRIIIEGEEPAPVALPIPAPAPQLRAVACSAPRDPKVVSAPVDEVTESRQVRRAEKRAAEKRASEAVQRRGYNSRNAKFVPTSLNSAAVEAETPAWVRSPGERERWRAIEKNVSIIVGARARIALPTFYRVPDKYGCVGIDGEFRRPGDRAAARWNATAAITHETWDAFGTLAAYDAHGMRRPQDWYRFRDRALGYLARAMGTDDIRTFEQTHDHAAVLAAFDHAIGESVHDAASGHFAPWYRP